MELLKTLFPLSFGIKDVANLIIKILIYLVIGVVVGFVLGLFSLVPVLGLIFSLLRAIVNLYLLAAIVIAILDFCKVLKQEIVEANRTW